MSKRYRGVVDQVSTKSAGTLETENIQDIEDSDFLNRSVNLYLADWSERLGWPRSVTIYENRILFFSNEAFPAKLWFSAQPGFQRVPVGRKTEISKGTDTSVETRLQKTLYDTVYFDQLDMFNIDSKVTGLIPEQASSSGAYFINDNKGFTGYWIEAGEVLFIGTNQGIFTSKGTNVNSNNPIPFNTGFEKSINHPVKRVYPKVIDESLYFISEDNSVQALIYQRGRNGFVTSTIDSLSKDVVRDVTEKTFVEKTIKEIRLVEVARNVGGSFITGKTFNNLDFNIPDASKTYQIEEFRNTRSQNTTILEWGVKFIKEPKLGAIESNTLFFRACVANLATTNITRSDSEINALLLNTSRNAKDLTSLNFSLSSELVPIGAMVSQEVGTDYDRTEDNDYTNDTIIVAAYRKGVTLPNYKVKIKGLVTDEEIEMSLSATESPIRRPSDDGLYSTAISEIKTALKGKLDNGYILNKKSLPDAVSSTRVCGAERISPNILRLFFNKRDIGFTHISISTQGVDIKLSHVEEGSLYHGEIGSVSDQISDSNEFGREVKTVFYADITTALDIPTNGNIKLLVYASELQVDNVEGETNFEFELLDTKYIMRDDLLNNMSGEYILREMEIVDERIDEDAPPTSEQARQDLQHFNFGTLSKSQMTTFFNSHLREGYEDFKFVFGDGGIDIPLVEQVVNIVETEVVESVRRYPVFNSHTRMIFDWTMRSLFIFRRKHPYLSFTYDKEAGIFGWSRGKMDLDDAVFVNTLPFRPPEVFPSLFGIKDNKILMLTRGIITKTDAFIEKLPNSLDESVVFEIEDNKINYRDIKNSLKEIGYRDSDKVTIAHSKGSIRENVRLDSLEGIEKGLKESSLIVGKPFSSILTLWFPYVATREGVSLGSQFNITEAVFNALHFSEFNLNRDLVFNKENNLVKKFNYGSSFLKIGARTTKDYDPIFEIKAESPFPLSIGGYILMLGGNSK